MACLVFDIETSALGLEHFDEAQQEYLFRDAARLSDPDEQARRRAEITQQFSLWPLTAQVVCIAMVNADSGKGQVLYQSDDFEEEEDVASGVEFILEGLHLNRKLNKDRSAAGFRYRR